MTNDIQIIGQTRLLEADGSHLGTPSLTRLDHGPAAILLGRTPIRPEADYPFISPQSEILMLTIENPASPAPAQPEIIPNSSGAGANPTLFPLGENRYMLLDNFWEFLPENERPGIALKDKTLPGWISYGGAHTRDASFENGAWTFGPSNKITVDNCKIIFTGRSAARISGHEYLVPCIEHELNRQLENRILLLRTPDGGATWEHFADIDRRSRDYAALSEPAIFLTGENTFGLLARTENKFDYMLGSTSTDGGRTWFRPERTDIQGSPPFILDAGGGATACIHAYHYDSSALRICISRDKGANWDTTNTITLLDAAEGEKLDSPAAIRLDDGSFLAVFTRKPENGPESIDAIRFEMSL